MLGILIFTLGSAFAIAAMHQLWFFVIILGIVGIIFALAIDKMTMVKGREELVIKKLCYVYAFIEILEDNKATRTMRRVLKELALDTCGMGHYSLWLKWESYFKQEFKKKMEENDEKY